MNFNSIHLKFGDTCTNLHDILNNAKRGSWINRYPRNTKATNRAPRVKLVRNIGLDTNTHTHCCCIQTCDPVSTHCRGCPVSVFQNRIVLSAVPPPDARIPCYGDGTIDTSSAKQWQVDKLFIPCTCALAT